jgi:predicted membrane chloride channel (bestrophin family)
VSRCGAIADLSSVLQPQELQLIASQPHTGTAILQALGAVVAASSIKEAQKLRIDENITCLQDTMGGCERWAVWLVQLRRGRCVHLGA